MSMPFYVAPEQVMKDRADYARKGIARGRSLVAARLRRRHPHLRREPVEHAAQGQRDLRPHRLRRRRQVQRVRPAAHRRRPRTPTSRATQYSREDVDARSLANQYAQILGQVFTHEMKPMEVEILVAEVGADAGRRPAVPHPLRRHRRSTRTATACSAARPRPSPSGSRRRGATGSTSPTRSRRASTALAGPDRALAGRRPRGRRARPRATAAARSAASTTPRSRRCCRRPASAATAGPTAATTPEADHQHHATAGGDRLDGTVVVGSRRRTTASTSSASSSSRAASRSSLVDEHVDGADRVGPSTSPRSSQTMPSAPSRAASTWASNGVVEPRYHAEPAPSAHRTGVR